MDKVLEQLFDRDRHEIKIMHSIRGSRKLLNLSFIYCMMSLYILSGILQIVDACYNEMTHLTNIMIEAPKLFGISKIGKIKHFEFGGNHVNDVMSKLGNILIVYSNGLGDYKA